MRRDSSLRSVILGLAATLGIGTFAAPEVSAQVLRSSSHTQSGSFYGPANQSRSVFGSPFANQPFSISGMNGGLNRLAGSPSTGIPGPGSGAGGWCGNGSLGGLGLVAPGWWGLGWGPGGGFWGPGYGMYPSAWWVGGWNTGFIGNGFIGNGFMGPGWGWDPMWNMGPWPMWNQGFVWDWGFLGAMDNVVLMGNSRFGPARPVRQQRAAARNGIQVPGNPNGAAGGLNAVPPMGAGMAGMNPRMPLVLRPANRGAATPSAPVATKPAPPDRLQTADRLARNGLFDEALNRYREIAKNHPNDPAPWIRIAQVEALAGRPAEAIAAFSQGETSADGKFTEVVKSKAWSDIADSVAADRLRSEFEEWSHKPEFAGIERLKATLTAPERPAVVQVP